MKAIVEWGRPKAATHRKICGMSGEFIVENPTKAAKLAGQLFHSILEGRDKVGKPTEAWGVSTKMPRKVVWASDNSFYVAVSLLDGVMRGPYAGVKAEQDYHERIQVQLGAAK